MFEVELELAVEFNILNACRGVNSVIHAVSSFIS